MNAALELVHGHVTETARRALEASRDAERSGLSDDEWWDSVLPTLTRVFADRYRSYPLTARVGTTIGTPHSDPRYGLDFGLDRILDGIEALVHDRAPPAATDH